MNNSPWSSGHGTYYVKNVDIHLELCRTDTITALAIRKSKSYDHGVLKDDKENSQVS